MKARSDLVLVPRGKAASEDDFRTPLGNLALARGIPLRGRWSVALPRSLFRL